MNYWLLKTEPSTYSFSDLLRDKKTNWNGVRNFQARNNLRKMEKGDLALIYHSGEERAVIGVAHIVRPAYVDPDQEGENWVQVDLGPKQKFTRSVRLSEIKETRELLKLPLIKQSRLSVMPITKQEFDVLVKMGARRKD